MACRYGMFAVVKMLLFKRMPISSVEYSLNNVARYESKPWLKDADGHTALMLALLHQHFHIVIYLIQCELGNVYRLIVSYYVI